MSTALFRQVRDSYTVALAPGTQVNRAGQARTYVMFMLGYELDVMRPHCVEIMMYIQCLVNSQRTLRTIKNYLSGAKTFVVERGGQITAFSHPMVGTYLKGVDRNIDYAPRPAVVVPASVIARACSYLRRLSSEGRIVSAIILFLYATMLCQGHVLYTPYGLDHTIRRDDILLHNGVMLVLVKSSKTTSKNNRSIITVFPVHDRHCCPVYAYQEATALAPAGGGCPLFLHPDTREMLTPGRVTALWREALLMVGFDRPGAATLHSLRRTGAHTCALGGVPVQEIQDHGLWRSDCVKRYLPKKTSCSAKVIAHSLQPYN